MGDVVYTESVDGKRHRRPRRVVFFVILLLLLSGIIFGVLAVKGTTNKTTQKAAPSPTDYVFPTETLEPSPTVLPTITSASPTEAVTPTQSPIDPKTKLDRRDLSVSVQNGSGEVGGATTASDFLKSFGYHVVAIGNADNFDYDGVTIQISNAKADYLPLLKSDIATKYTISSASGDLSASSSADAVVIFGK